MTNQCPRCGAPQPGALPICQQCGLDFRTIGAQPAPAAAAYQQAQPQSQEFQQPAPPPQGVPTVCPRCQAPLYPGYPICGNCGLDLRAAWGSGPAAGPAHPMLPIALAIGLVVVLLAAAGAVFVMAQPKGSATPSQAVASSAMLDSSPGETGPTTTLGTVTTSGPVVPVKPTPTAGPTLGPGGGVASEGNWTGLDTTTGIFTVTFTVSGNTSLSQFGFPTVRASYVSGQDPYASYSGSFNPAVDRYLNSAAFFNPASFQFGDLGRYNNWLRGPAVNSEPLSAQKRINITERVVTELRIDAANPYNMVRWSNPNTSITSASFGVISGAQGARVVQLNLTLKF